MNDGLRDLRPDAADDAVGPHQPRRRNGLQQVLRRQRIDGRHAGDIDDGDFGAVIDDVLKKVFHHDLRARAVERSDDRDRQNPSHNLTTGVESSVISRCCRQSRSSRLSEKVRRYRRPRSSSRSVTAHIIFVMPRRADVCCLRLSR